MLAHQKFKQQLAPRLRLREIGHQCNQDLVEFYQYYHDLYNWKVSRHYNHTVDCKLTFPERQALDSKSTILNHAFYYVDDKYEVEKTMPDGEVVKEWEAMDVSLNMVNCYYALKCLGLEQLP